MRFRQWLKQHEPHVAAYAEAEKLWSSFDSIKSVKLLELSRVSATSTRSILSSLATIPLLAAASGWWFDYQAPATHYATPIGERQSVQLADGSVIELNAATDCSFGCHGYAVRLDWIKAKPSFPWHEHWQPFDVYSALCESTTSACVLTPTKIIRVPQSLCSMAVWNSAPTIIRHKA